MKKIEVEDKKRKVSYRELVSKYKLLSDLMNYVPDVIYFKDKAGRLIMVNQAHAKGLGLKPEEVVGKRDSDFFPKKRAAKMAKDDNYVIKTGKSIIDKIERATRPDGVDNYVSTTKIPRFDDKGNIVGLVGITRDITRRMQLEHLKEEKAHIEKKLEVLQELDKLKSEFISIVSHELRTPLAVIKEAVMLLLDEITGPVNDKQRKLLTNAKDNIESLRHIIEELLDISRIESGRFRLHYSLVNLNDLLIDLSGFFKRLAEDKGIRLEYILPKKEVNIFVDADRINQALSNLISNAMKFTEEGGEIKVELKVFENKVRAMVSDTGIGIAKADLPKLFNKFVQVSGIKSAEKKGLGLGLSITKDLIEKHGGEIWAESKLGVGSRFYFTIPRFCTIDLLGSQIKDKINNLLTNSAIVYLFHLLIVNYGEFKKRVTLEPTKLFDDFKIVIYDTFKEFFKSKKEIPQFVLTDTTNGECSIIFSEATEGQAQQLYRLVKDNIKSYFVKNNIQDIFVNFAIFTYSPKARPSTTGQVLANLRIKQICIGPEKRHYKRFDYKLDIEIIISENERETSKTIDVSRGGISFTTERLLKTDANINIRLQVPRNKRPLSLDGRVAWIKDMQELPKIGRPKYKVGVEFVHLKNKDKRIVSRLIKSITVETKRLITE